MNIGTSLIGVVIPMFRSGTTTVAVIEALSRCHLPAGYDLKVVVVDDASDDGSAERIEELSLPRLTLLRNETNRGRSAARNRGARDIEADWLLFVDSDCIPSDDRFIANHLSAARNGVKLSMGAVGGADDGFWHSYQNAAFERRLRDSHVAGIAISGSSQNFMIDRQIFLDAGGFDESYSNYGFEDRDLFLRIEESGHRLAWATNAAVAHHDRLSLLSVCKKMAEAGGAPADRFRARHPVAYRRMGYSSVDVCQQQWLRAIEPITSLYVRLMAPWLTGRLESSWLPLRLRMTLAKTLIAASYLHGTASAGDTTFLKRKS